MSMVVLDNYEERTLREKRKSTGADRWDEVWDGVYMVMPLPNDEHQGIVSGLIYVFETMIGRVGLGKVRPGVNVSDRDGDWEQNYRGPDVVVFLEQTTAVNRGSYWLGGPDFAVEVVSKGDRSREKLDFYASVNVRELLLVDRYPWSLELYRLNNGALELVGRSTTEDPATIISAVLPLSFRLLPGQERPSIEIAHTDGQRHWSV
jgi:Uma2 family endonuclease